MNKKLSVTLLNPASIEIGKFLIVSLFLIFWFAVIILFPSSPNLHPIIKSIIGWLWFLLPGIVLSKMLFKTLSWIEKIPVSYVLSIGISTPITVYAILARLSLNQLKWLYSGIFLLLILLLLIYTYWERIHGDHHIETREIQREGFPPIAFGFLSILIILVLLFCYISIIWPPYGDDLAGLPILADTLHFEKIKGTEPFHGTQTPVTPRNELTVWIYQNTLVAHIADLNAVELLVNSRAIFILISFLGLFTFLNHYLKGIRPALFLLCVWAIFLLVTLQADGTGSDFVTRIVQDKFQGWFIVVPIVMTFVLWYLESYRKRYLIAVGIGMVAATLMHPITFTQVLILTAGLSSIYLILNPSKETLKNITPLAVVAVICLSVLIIQYFRYTGYSPIELVGLGDAVEYGRLTQAISRYRLWILDDSYYILHPSIILQPIILLGYLFLPILILRLRKDPAARLIIPALIILPLLLYIPQLAKITGKFVTPYLMWRLSWPLPMFAVFTIGWVIWLFIGRLIEPVNHFGEKIHSSTRVIITLSLIMIIIFLVIPDIKISLRSFQERLADGKYSTCNLANDILLSINQIADEEPVSILASKSLNYCIPGIAPLANVIEYRGYGTINRLPEDQANESLQRVLDIEYFSSSFYVDDLVMSIIDRYDVDYILVENDRMQFNMQFNQLIEIFQKVYADHHYTLYKYKGLPTKSSIISGNQSLRERKWETAIEIFTRIGEKDPDNLLANIGLGHAHEGNGDIQTAFSYFLYASLTDHSEPAVHLLLADTYLTLHDPDNAILAYKQALNLDSFRSEIHKSLANAYAINDQSEDAIKEVEKSVSLTSEKLTAKHFSSKATILSSIGYNQLAEKNIYQALAIEPTSDRYIQLAQILLNSEQIETAKKILINAIEHYRWLDTPHYNLGLIHLEEQNYELAIKEFESSWRLNPTNQSAFKSLGSSINEYQGEQAAISRMTNLLQLNSLLPGPQLGMVQILIENEHYEKSLEILQNSSRILPRDASILEDIGDLQYDLERYDQALNSYNQAISNNPNQIGALFGLSLLYNAAGDRDAQRGQLYRITRINPFAAWPHLTLSNIHQQMGDFGSAINESEWAIKLAQDDPSAYLTLGNIYQTLAQFDQAILFYKRVIEIEPESFEAYIALAQMEIVAGNFTSALSLIDVALQNNPDSAEVWIALGNYYYFLGDYQSAAIKFKRAIELDPESADAVIQLSDTQFKLLDYQGSLSTLEKSLELLPDDLSLYQKYINLLRWDNKQTEVWNTIDRAIQNNPDSSEAYGLLANEYKRAGDQQRAILTFNHAIQLDPLNADAYYQLASVYKDSDILDDAEQVYLDLLDRYPYSTSAHTNLGNYYIQQGNLEKAQEVFIKMQDLPAKSADSYLGLSKISQIEGNWDIAIDILEDAISEVPNPSQAYQNLGVLYLQRGQVENARWAYEQAVEINPGEISLYESLTYIYSYLGNEDLVNITFMSALKHNPGSSNAHLAYANYLEEIGDIKTAEDFYRSALEIDPTDPSIYNTLSQFLLKQGRDEEALSIILGSLEVPLFSSETYRYIGNTYFSIGDVNSAIDWYNTALVIQPTDVNSLIALSSVFQDQSEQEKALDALIRAVDLQPTNLYARYSLAYYYKAIGEVDKAIREFNLICTMDPLQSDCHLALGNIAQDQGNWSEAIHEYRTTIKINPTYLAAYSQAGNTYRVQNLDPEALLEYTNGIRYSLDKQSAYLERAAFYESRGHLDKASQDYQTVYYLNSNNVDSALQLVQFYKRRGEIETALSILTKYAQSSTTDATFYNELGNIYLTLGKITDAVNTFEEGIQLFGSELSLYTNLSTALSLQGKPDDVINLLQLTPQNVSDKINANLTLGDTYQTRLDYEQAHLFYQQALELDPSNLTTIIKLDNLERKMGYSGMDLAALENRSDINLDSGSFITLGYQYQSRGNLQKATESFNKAVELKPLNSYAWLALGSHYRFIQQNDRAMDALTKAAMLNPNNPDILIAMGSLQKSLDLTEQATMTYERLISADRSRIDGYVKLAGIQSDQGDHDQAVETLNQGLMISPSGIEGYLTIANILYEEGSKKDALNVLENAITIFPGSPELYVGKAEILAGDFLEIQRDYELALGNYIFAQQRVHNSSTELETDIAVEHLRTSEELLIEAETYYRDQLAMYEVNLSDYQVAIELYKHALELKPDDEDAHLGLAYVAYATGETEKALSYYHKTIKMHPTSYNALYNLAYVYLEIDQPEKAAELFMELIKYYPYYESGHIGLSRALGAQDTIYLSQAIAAAQSGQFRWINMINFLRSRIDIK